MEVPRTVHLLFAPFRIATSIALAPLAIAFLYPLLNTSYVTDRLHLSRLHLRRLLVPFSLGCILLFLYGAFATVARQPLASNDENSILSITAAYLHGQPIYHGRDAPSEYSMLYGPATFLLYSPPMLLHAINMRWFQAWVGLGLVLAVLCAAAALRRTSPVTRTLFFTAYFCMVLGQRAGNIWNTKSDPWIILFSAVGFAAACWLPALWADLLIAVSGSVLVNLKANLLLLALLPFAILAQRLGKPLRERLPAVAGLCALALGVFALPHISLPGYWQELDVAGRQGFSRSLLTLNAGVALQALLLPFCALLFAAWRMHPVATRSLLRQNRVFLAGLALAFALALLSGSKNGAGPWHLLPLALPFALLDAKLVHIALAKAQSRARLGAFAPALWFFLAAFAHGAYSTVEADQGRLFNGTTLNLADVQQDLLDVVRQHPQDRIQLGVGADSGYDLARMRYVLIAAGEPLFSDPNTRNERDAAGVPYSPAFLRAFQACAVTLWLTPKGDVPFSTQSPYAHDPYAARKASEETRLFPAPLPQEFQAHYTHMGASRYFDLWTCHTSTPDR